MMKVCYCFNHTEQDIIDDVIANNGRSTIAESIMANKKGGACQCEKNHPEKRWCLGDVRRVVDKAMKDLDFPV